MKTVCTLLGLSADASEESLHAAVTSIMNRNTTAEAALKPLQTELAASKALVTTLQTAQVETDLETYKNRYDNGQREFIKGLLITNRDSTLAFLKTQKEIAPAPVLNRAATGTPGAGAGAAAVATGEQDSAALAQQCESEVQTYRIQNRCTYEEASAAILRSKPELFGLKK